MKGVLLLSGGIDSPVAGHMMQKLGIELSCLTFTHGGDAKVQKLSKKIGCKSLAIRDFRKFQETVLKHANRRFQCILCKRHMYREAESYASEIAAGCIVTGESLGQVASQTLENMSILNEAVNIPVLRPLLGFDKEDTIRIAKSIGTYGLSIADSVDCPYAPKNPATRANLAKIKEEEWNIQGYMQDTHC